MLHDDPVAARIAAAHDPRPRPRWCSTEGLELRTNITYDDDGRPLFPGYQRVSEGSTVPDPYATGIAARRAASSDVNPSPLFQMAAEKDRKATDDRTAFEARDKQQRLAKLTREYRRHHEANPLPAPRVADKKYPAPDPYAKALKARQEKE